MSFPYNDQNQLLSQQAILAGVTNVSASGQGLLMVSAVNESTIALDGDATNNRVSAFQKDAGSLRVSGFSSDASLFRVSAFMVSLDTTNNVEKVEQQFNYFYVSATGIQVIKNAPTLLHSVTINKRGTASTMKIFDNTSAASGLQVATIDTTLSTTAFVYDVKLTAGLTVSAADAGAADLTFTFR